MAIYLSSHVLLLVYRHSLLREKKIHTTSRITDHVFSRVRIFEIMDEVVLVEEESGPTSSGSINHRDRRSKDRHILSVEVQPLFYCSGGRC